MKYLLSIILMTSQLAWSADKPPELWSWFKEINKSKEACEIQTSYTLQTLKLSNKTENKHGIYGHVKSNSVVVKCIKISDNKSMIMVAVAGSDRDSVEIVRNNIVRSIN